jgi:DNA-binding CsgD family transcriptional regulator
VGREDALAVIEGACADAAAGSPRLVIVEGPPGIGKSTLVRHALHTTRTALDVRVSRAFESEQLIPFALLDQIITGLAAAEGTEPWEDAVEAGGRLLASLGSGSDSATAIVVDDAQWSDVQSLRALAFVFRRLETDRVLFVMCARGPLDPDGVIARLGEDERARRISLAPLVPGEIRALAEQFGIPLGLVAAARLQRHTGGLPLYVHALLEEIDPAELGRSTGLLPAPRSFGVIVLRRLATAPRPVERLVSAVAVIGERAPAGVAISAADVDDPITTIDAAVGLGILEHRRGAGGDELRFVHALIRAAVLDGLAPARRAEMHLRVSEQLSGPDAIEHRAAAAFVPDAELATRLQQEATRDLERGAIELGVHRLLEAARLQADRVTARAWRLQALEALVWGGALASANELAADLSDELVSEDPRVLYVRGHLALLNMERSECERLLRAAWDRCRPSEDPAVAALIAVRLAQLYTIFGPEPTIGEALEWAERGYALLPDDPPGSLAPNGILMVSLALAGRPDEALRRALPEASTTAAIAQGVRRDTLDNGFDFVLGRGIVKLWTDDLPGARTDFELAGAAAGKLVPAIWTRLWALGFLAEVEYRSGQWDDSISNAEIAISLAEDTDHQWMLGLLHGIAILPSAARGDWDVATAHEASARLVASILDSTISVAFAAASGAALASARGDDDAVIAATDVLVAMDKGRGAMEPGVMDWCALRIEALARTGGMTEATALLDQASVLATQRQRSSTLADLSRARGVLESARGDNDAATRAFEQGEAELRTLGMPFRAALHQLAFGSHLRRLGQRRAAAARLEGAVSTFTHLGAGPYLERADAELAACGLHPRRRDVAAPALTAREQAVARLVAEGLTNAEIATKLFLSVKTVEYHLGNAFTKYGVRNRAQLAARLDV